MLEENNNSVIRGEEPVCVHSSYLWEKNETHRPSPCPADNRMRILLQGTEREREKKKLLTTITVIICNSTAAPVHDWRDIIHAEGLAWKAGSPTQVPVWRWITGHHRERRPP